MVESTQGASKNEADKPKTEAKPLDTPTFDKSLYLCMVGADKHWIEKDVIKFLRKSFAMKE